MQYILSIDQSKSATKAVLFNTEARLVMRANVNHGQFYPQPGWVEHDPEEIFNNTIGGIREISVSNPDKRTSTLAITNRRESIDRQGANDIRHVIKLFETRNFSKLIPDQSIICGNNPKDSTPTL